MIDLSQHKLELEYPCDWCYKIVIKDQHNGNKIAKTVLQDRDHTVTKSKTSSSGKFKSYNINTTVHSDEDRNNIHQLLKDHKQVQMVV